MKLMTMKQFDEAKDLVTVILNCLINKKLDSEIDQRHHNHSLKFLNGIKINSVLKLTVDEKVAKEYTPKIVNKNMQRMKWEKNAHALKKAEKVNLNFQTVYNAEKSFKKQNPDARILEAKND